VNQHAKTFLTGRHDDVLQSIIDGRETTFLVEAFRNGNISDVQKWSQQAYDELARKRKDEARDKDFWYKPATWGLHDRLTMLLVVIFLIMKISAYVLQNHRSSLSKRLQLATSSTCRASPRLQACTRNPCLGPHPCVSWRVHRMPVDSISGRLIYSHYGRLRQGKWFHGHR
jgi:hypothetical protein